MKLKFQIATLLACLPGFLSAQVAAPEKPAAEKTEKIEEEPKAETPVEKMAFKIFEVLSATPEILDKVKDEASLEVAGKKFDQMFEKMKIEVAALQKLEIPDNEARKKLTSKMEILEKAMQQKMGPIMMKIEKLPAATTTQFDAVMLKMRNQWKVMEPTLEQYFQPDEEKDGK